MSKIKWERAREVRNIYEDKPTRGGDQNSKNYAAIMHVRSLTLKKL